MIWVNKTSDDCVGISTTVAGDSVILRIGPEEQGKGRYAVLTASEARRIAYHLLGTAERVQA